MCHGNNQSVFVLLEFVRDNETRWNKVAMYAIIIFAQLFLQFFRSIFCLEINRGMVLTF